MSRILPWCWQTLRLLMRRLCLWSSIVGRPGWPVGRVRPGTAWRVAKVVYPWRENEESHASVKG